jgi:hypothetical protein
MATADSGVARLTYAYRTPSVVLFRPVLPNVALSPTRTPLS